jgi:trk system potassium uptake protein TrkA
MKRFVVIGLGNFGSTVAAALQAQRHDVIAVDIGEAAVERIADRVARAVVGDGRSLQTLQQIGAENADGAVVSTGDDITSSILATMALRDLGVTAIYVKVISADHARVMEKLGVTETVFPERDSAMRLATRISSATILNYFRLAPDFGIQEMAVPTGWIGRCLRDLRLRDQLRISVVALRDVLTDTIATVPNPDTPLKESDTLLVAGRDADLAEAAKLT